MKKSDKPCRIIGVSCGELSIKFGGTGEKSLKSVSALQDADGNIHGKTDYVGPWPQDVVDLVNKMKDAVEAHMETIHFEVTRNDTATAEHYDAAAPGENSKPTGLFGTGLGAPKDEPDQL